MGPSRLMPPGAGRDAASTTCSLGSPRFVPPGTVLEMV